MQSKLEQLIQDSGIRHEKIIQHLGMTYESWRNRRADPLTIKIGELAKLARVLHTKPDVLLMIILEDHPVS